MSFEVMTWAARQNPGSMAEKMVLLAMSNCATPDGLTAPTVGYIQLFGRVDPRTVIAARDRLLAAGYVRDTGARAGRTRQIPVYQLQLHRPSDLPRAPALKAADRSAAYRALAARDGKACYYCGSIGRLEVDHVLPRSRGGSNELGNLRLACAPCNAAKGVRSLEEWRRC
jgi:hypothetical protein